MLYLFKSRMNCLLKTLFSLSLFGIVLGNSYYAYTNSMYLCLSLIQGDWMI